ncbi:winged helix-turn-helix transcriptional regulator [Sediminibacterium soli]|uniref:winged helix-turn-helix transcriptional regulator n=1 Tax=Sediminibacterium soli TaxID=2698829 RepID=UPI00137B9245|nr:helix-turn-helix domain-containing protein [Sediminibacterium soli]NCI47596.1 helix-turn-helix transcriptional regulator [Sediminibacterium soli]
MERNDSDNIYLGCPVQHTRQFIAGKWQMGILWSLRDQTLCFSAIKNQLPDISDKILTQELNFFLEKKIITRSASEFSSPKTEYTLAAIGETLIPVIASIVEWGYRNLQDERFNTAMNKTPLRTIQAIRNNITGTE